MQAEQQLLEVNRDLRKNRSILRKLCPAGKATVRHEVLVAMDYNFNLFSSIYLTSNKIVYYICYDYAFTPIFEHGVKKAVIVTKQDQMNSWDPWRFVKATSRM